MRKRKRDAQDILPPPVRAVAIAVLAVIVLIPIPYTLLLSVTPDTQVGSENLIPSEWAFGNYVQMWTTVSLAQGLSNSLIISGIANVIAVILSVGAGYIITRFTFRGRLPYLYSLIGLQTVPSVMLLLPLFVLFASIQAAIHFIPMCVQSYNTEVRVAHLSVVRLNAHWYQACRNIPGSSHHLPDVRASVRDLAHGLLSRKHPDGP